MLAQWDLIILGDSRELSKTYRSTGVKKVGKNPNIELCSTVSYNDGHLII
jgi:hypothetical protein